ncbi:MAG TPA: hypothetical protein DHW14_08790 [Clostridiales bacterium]|nr:hypothetical protein [Clostridiales bacterium]
MVTHNASLARRAGRVLGMRDGRLDASTGAASEGASVNPGVEEPREGRLRLPEGLFGYLLTDVEPCRPLVMKTAPVLLPCEAAA